MIRSDSDKSLLAARARYEHALAANKWQLRAASPPLGTRATPERRNLKCQRKGLDCNSCKAVRRGARHMLRSAGSGGASRASPPAVGLDRITGAECQIGKRRQHLSTRQNVG